MLADSLEGARSVGAVKWCRFTAGHGCEGPQPSRSLPIIVARNGWAIAGRFPGGRPLRRRREMVLIYGHQRLRGTAALQVADHRCYDRIAIAGRSPGGRPLRRRRETVLIYGHQRLRGTAALSRSPIIVATTGWPLLAEALVGVRSVGAVKWC